MWPSLDCLAVSCVDAPSPSLSVTTTVPQTVLRASHVKWVTRKRESSGLPSVVVHFSLSLHPPSIRTWLSRSSRDLNACTALLGA
ncbi:hypothetical protein CALVIDRAFT_538676 [Calocera viscosa TUFC12733]|uniref:Uncharacterized protein n=1 Tax=Calocera viscosa (strain TUFC12733) TaxID=1330018 RepID=A0A167KR04_CALVF|nr:hypothetical protein CALVIDRAFT_538676 [Calocera viscosa TUFC12733]